MDMMAKECKGDNMLISAQGAEGAFLIQPWTQD